MYQMDEWICSKLIIFHWIVLDLYPFYYVWFALLVDKDKPLTFMVGCTWQGILVFCTWYSRNTWQVFKEKPLVSFSDINLKTPLQSFSYKFYKTLPELINDDTNLYHYAMELVTAVCTGVCIQNISLSLKNFISLETIRMGKGMYACVSEPIQSKI